MRPRAVADAALRAPGVELLLGEAVADPPAGVLQVEPLRVGVGGDVVAKHPHGQREPLREVADERLVGVRLVAAQEVVHVQDQHAQFAQRAGGEKVQRCDGVRAAAHHGDYRSAGGQHLEALGGATGDVGQRNHPHSVPRTAWSARLTGRRVHRRR